MKAETAKLAIKIKVAGNKEKEERGIKRRSM